MFRRSQAWRQNVERLPGVGLVLETLRQFGADGAPRLAAALSYYALFSLAPILVFSILTASLLLDAEEVRREMLAGIEALIGPAGATAVRELVSASRGPGSGFAAALTGLFLLAFGAMGVFNQLQRAFDTIWNVPPRKRQGWRSFLQDRVLSLGMVLSIAFLLLVSLIIGSLVRVVAGYVEPRVPATGILWPTLQVLLGAGAVFTILFLMFRYGSSARPRPRDVALGAAVTTALFMVGQYLIGFYVNRDAFQRSYGGAASVVAVLVWLYYAALLLFFGAEFTQVWSERRGRSPNPGGRKVRAGS